MDFIYLRHHDIHKNILKYAPENGHSQELDRSELPREQELARGFYVSIDDSMVGVYPSKDGPICFYNDQRFLLADDACQLVLVTGAEENQFILRWQDKERFCITYPKPKSVDFDPWSDEEMVDFFYVVI